MLDTKLKMEELNRNTLTNALAQLPDYPPDASVWSAIDLQLSIGEMQTFNPPVSIWNNLEKQLELDKNAVYTEGSSFELKTSLRGTKQTNEELKISETSSLKVVKQKGLLRHLSFQKLAIAAAMTGLIFTVFNLLKPNYTEGSSLKYSTEVVDNQLLKNTSDDAEADYQMVENFCQQQIAACETPAFKTLKSELDELNSARETIKNAIGDFNSDADLMIQLKDIEQQRATILRQIVGVM
jgi:hypothetical protein